MSDYEMAESRNFAKATNVMNADPTTMLKGDQTALHTMYNSVNSSLPDINERGRKGAFGNNFLGDKLDDMVESVHASHRSQHSS